MLEFAVLKQKAMQLPRKLMRYNAENVGCMGFFSAIMPSCGSLDGAETIKKVAESLKDENNKDLREYVRSFSKFSRVSDKEFAAFKSKVLVGIYLLVWSHYNSSVSAFLNKSFIEHLQTDLGVDSVEAIDDELFQSSLKNLSYYCSFVYQNRDKNEFFHLNKQLGISIQADIEKVRQSRCITDNSWFGVYSGMFCSLWMTNKS